MNESVTQAESVLRALRDQLAQIYSVPRMLKQVCEDLGVEVRPLEGSSYQRSLVARGSNVPEGLFVPLPSPVIFLPRLTNIDSLDRDVRNRFTCAHELAHFLIWHSLKIMPDNDYWEHEVLCNRFAGQFLVPDEVLAKIFVKRDRTWLSRVNVVAEVCRVSWDVAANAMTGHSGGALIFLRCKTSQNAKGQPVFVINSISTMQHFGHRSGQSMHLVGTVQRELEAAMLNRESMIDCPFDTPQIPLKGKPMLIQRLGNGFISMIRVGKPEKLVF